VLVPLATEQRVYDLSSAYSMLDVSSAPLRYLLDIACIPPAWLLEAQATRCAYERKPQFQLAALYCAMQMADRAEAPRLRTEAATLLVTQLAPLLIVQGRVEQLRAWLLDLSAGGPLEPLMQSPHVAYLLMLDVVSDSAVDSMEGSSSADQIAQAAQRVLTLIEQSKGSASSLVDRYDWTSSHLTSRFACLTLCTFDSAALACLPCRLLHRRHSRRSPRFRAS
jgi:hypothetical protein